MILVYCGIGKLDIKIIHSLVIAPLIVNDDIDSDIGAGVKEHIAVDVVNDINLVEKEIFHGNFLKCHIDIIRYRGKLKGFRCSLLRQIDACQCICSFLPISYCSVNIAIIRCAWIIAPQIYTAIIAAY